DDLLQLRRDGWLEFTRRNGIVQQAVVHDHERIGTGERHFAGQHFVEHDAQRVDVTAGVATFPFYLLGRNVVGRADRLREFREGNATRTQVGGNAKVNQLDVIIRVHHDVFRFQITMNHSVSMYVFDCGRDLQGDFDRALRR